jgi:glycosyltransferase involved in cell wall biosynthesis
MMMKKILFLIGSLNGGGAERVLLQILEHLNQKEFKCYIALGSMTGEYIESVPEHVEIIDLSSSYNVFIKNIFSLNKSVNKYQIDLIVSFMPNANLLALRTKYFLKPGLKVIVTEHNNPHKNYLKSNFKLKSLIKKIDLKFFYRYSDTIVTVSNGIRKELIKDFNLPPKIISTIYNPASLKEINNKKHEMPIFFKKKSNKKTIISIGRLVTQKGYFNMLEIIKQLNEKIPVRLIILGEGPLRCEIEQKILELKLKNVVFLIGFVDNPWAYIYNSDVYLSTSLWEGFHMTIVESMACGIFPIVSDCNYGPNEIIKNKEMGKLIPVHANKEFVNELFLFLSKHETGYKYNACIERSKFFETSIIVEHYTELFKSA